MEEKKRDDEGFFTFFLIYNFKGGRNVLILVRIQAWLGHPLCSRLWRATWFLKLFSRTASLCMAFALLLLGRTESLMVWLMLSPALPCT
jgi:hypothetical protein